MKYRYLSIVLGPILLVGCSSSSSTSDDETQDTILTGVLIDSAVEGMDYTTATQSGTTNMDGEFNYVQGESVVFSLGSMALPSVAAGENISPMELAQSSSDISTTSSNIARLFQSLDSDGNPSNGITVDASAATSAATIDFDVSPEEFEQSTNVINLIANSGSTNSTLISSDQANEHLFETWSQASDGSLAGLAGISDTSNAELGRTSYSIQRGDGTATSFDFDPEMNCYNTTEFAIEVLGDNRFRVTRPNDPDREPLERVFLKTPAARLTSYPDDDSDRDNDGDITDTIYIIWPAVTNVTEGDLNVCT